MRKRNILKIFITIVLTLAVIFSSFHFTAVTAAAKHGNGGHGNHNDRWDKDKDKDNGNNWWNDEDSKDKSDYLVLIGQTNGTYTAYDDIAFLTAGRYVMVKADPLAAALGMTYRNNAGKWHKKGCSLALGQNANVYIKNKKSYYFYGYDSSTRQLTCVKYTAQYKQMVHQSYNAVHCASLNTLVNYQYYDTSSIAAYSSLGYRGVVVYNRYNTITQLPDLANVTNLSNSNNNNNNNGNSNNNGGNNYATVTVKPTTTTDSNFNAVKYVEASYTSLQSNNPVNLDLNEVLGAFCCYGLPYDGIYGYGNCDTAITLRGIDKNGASVGEIKTTGGEFLVNFPKAVKLSIIGEQRNLIIDFMPVKPIVITDTARLSFNQIGWLYPSDKYARQYFVISEYKRFYPENVTSSYTLSRKILDVSNRDNPDYANAYQRITAVFMSPYYEMVSPNCYINVQKTNTTINNSLVVFNNTSSSPLAADYEKQLVSMITTIKNTGQNTYYPAGSFNRQLTMKPSDNTVNTDYSYIFVDPVSLNLDFYYDYYNHLHEMAHFYEATKMHYGFRFQTWIDGNASTLAKKTMDNLKISYKDVYGNDCIDALYKTNYSFLTQNDKNNFEACYLNATGWNATVIGYHFTKFLQDMYGSDVVYRILQKVYAANIPTGSGRNSTYDKQFTDCIKAVTSANVFQLFVQYCIN